jgi:hypothetical protein
MRNVLLLTLGLVLATTAIVSAQDDGERPSISASVGGPRHADGTEIACDLPGELHRANTSSKGLGLCVFTSIHHSAVWQNVPALQEFPKYLIDKNIPGGGLSLQGDGPHTQGICGQGASTSGLLAGREQ